MSKRIPTAGFSSLLLLAGAGVCAVAATIAPASFRALTAAAALTPTPIARMLVLPVGRRRPSLGLSTPTPVSSQPTATPFPTSPFTRTPGDTPRPAPTATPTPRPTAQPTIVIMLRAVDWQWDFYGVPGQVDGGPDATLHVGQTYELHVFNGGIPDTPPHQFSGSAALGISGYGPLDAGGPEYVVTFRPTVIGGFSYQCADSSCGVGHDGMQGLITILP